MSARTLRNLNYQHDAYPVKLYCWCLGAGAGADMTLQYWNPGTQAIATAPTGGWRGIKSVTYNAATGKYKINLQDAYRFLIHFNMEVLAVDGSTAPVTPTGYIESISVTGATPYVAIVVTNAAGTATAPTSNSRFYFELTLSNSTAP